MGVTFNCLPPDSVFNFMDVPDFPAGTNWSYSNTGYVIAGLIIEAVDGKPFHQSIRDRFLTPFGLAHTYLGVYESHTEPKAGSWLINGAYLGIDFDSFLSIAWAAGAIISTPADLAEWAYLLYSGKILNSTSLNDMTTPVVVNGSQTNYGLGFVLKRYKNKNYHGHGGTTLQNSTMNYAEDLGYSIVLNVNEQGAGSKTFTIENLMIDVLESEMPKYAYEPISVEEVTSSESILVYPNPASQIVNFSGKALKTVSILDLNGRVVLTDTNPTSSLDISSLKSGFYFIHLYGKDGFNQSQKLLVK